MSFIEMCLEFSARSMLFFPLKALKWNLMKSMKTSTRHHSYSDLGAWIFAGGWMLALGCLLLPSTCATALAQTCTPPAFTDCPSSGISSSTDEGACTAVVTYTAAASGTPAPTLSYVFSGATTASGGGTGSGSTFNEGVTTVTITADNSCSPDATCQFTVTVEDNENPSITCPSNATVSGAGDVPPHATDYASFVAQGGSASDNCPGQVTVAWISDDIINQTCPNRYVIDRGYIATDTAGNSATCDQMIVVDDE